MGSDYRVHSKSIESREDTTWSRGQHRIALDCLSIADCNDSDESSESDDAALTIALSVVVVVIALVAAAAMGALAYKKLHKQRYRSINTLCMSRQCR